MRDIFEFLIQSISVSIVGIFILTVKRIFRDKLPPVWQFSIWGIFAITLIIPISQSVLIPFAAEILKTFITGEYTVSRPAFFFPVPDFSKPENIADVLFLIYFIGTLAFLIKYVISYLKLKRLIGKATPLSEDIETEFNEIARKYSLKKCDAVIMKGLSSPFIFGIIKPILVIPEEFPDEKVILHELIHLKYKDALWGILISFFRSIHWCNPFLLYCFGKIRNDIEELCDSRVLSLLDGEERRDYGNLLLSMANEKYASCFGTTSIANGGKNIRSRIETIVRFKKYPADNKLVCISISVIMALFLLVHADASAIQQNYINLKNDNSVDIALAASRSFYCKTPAAAIDAYMKSVLQSNGIYRALCAPLSLHEEIENDLKTKIRNGETPKIVADIDGSPKSDRRYSVYNLEEASDNEYSAYVVFNLNYYDTENENNVKLAYQKIKVFKENERWVVTEDSDFSYIVTYKMQYDWGCEDLPVYTYTCNTDDFTVERNYQLCFSSGEQTQNSAAPILDAKFSEVTVNTFSRCIYNGPEDKKSEITQLGFSCKAGKSGNIPDFPDKPTNNIADKYKDTVVWDNISEEIKDALSGGDFSSTSSSGSSSASKTLLENWDNIQDFSGGGHTTEYRRSKNYLPEIVYGVFYINGQPSDILKLERIS